jgi:chaperonin GroEL
MKKIEFNTKEKILSAIDKLSSAVGSTLGAGGRNALIQLGSDFAITKDGVTVARQIEFDDETENAVAQIVKEAAARTARDAGDGTTTSVVLVWEIIRDIMERDDFENLNVTKLRQGIEEASKHLIKEAAKKKKDITKDKEIENIATISGNNDPEIGKMMLDVYKAVGKEGAVRLEETEMNNTLVDVANGCQIESGYINANFSNNKAKRVVDYENPLIFITDKKFENGFDELTKPLELMLRANQPAIIICGGMEGEPLGTLVINRVQKGLRVAAVEAPYFGSERIDVLDDIAAMTGAVMVSETRGFKIEDVTLEMLGTADRIVIDEQTTTIFGRKGEKEEIEKRVDYIKTQQEEDRDGLMKWRLNQRLASLTAGVGVIYVGGHSEAEMKDMFYRLEDALAATKAALHSGYVAGGGLAYYRASDALPGMSETSLASNVPYAIGYTAMLNAAKAPVRWIMENAGFKGDMPTEIGKLGFNALTFELTNIEKQGIIDPFKVIESCISNAASVAGMLITTNVIITNKLKK